MTHARLQSEGQVDGPVVAVERAPAKRRPPKGQALALTAGRRVKLSGERIHSGLALEARI